MTPLSLSPPEDGSQVRFSLCEFLSDLTVSKRLAAILVVLFSFAAFPIILHAQRQVSALNDAEVEQLRDSAYIAADRVTVFIKFLDERSKSVQTLGTGPRKPGREQDLHDLMEQFTSIADELNDNLDEYGPAHRDMRKALPKLLAATDRWATAIRTPADHKTYNVTRKLALEAVRDLREESTRLIEEQRAWFAAHPPAKENKADPYAHPG